VIVRYQNAVASEEPKPGEAENKEGAGKKESPAPEKKEGK